MPRSSFSSIARLPMFNLFNTETSSDLSHAPKIHLNDIISPHTSHTHRDMVLNTIVIKKLLLCSLKQTVPHCWYTLLKTNWQYRQISHNSKHQIKTWFETDAEITLLKYFRLLIAYCVDVFIMLDKSFEGFKNKDVWGWKGTLAITSKTKGVHWKCFITSIYFTYLCTNVI